MIVKPSDYLTSDRRFKKWAKKIVGPQELDLSHADGFALKGTWVNWDDAVALREGQWLVVAAMQGSAKYHSYHYALVSGATGEIVGKTDRGLALDSALSEGLITEEQYAATQNSKLFDFALYLSLVYRQEEQHAA